jgi:hypothetical protein
MPSGPSRTIPAAVPYDLAGVRGFRSGDALEYALVRQSVAPITGAAVTVALDEDAVDPFTKALFPVTTALPAGYVRTVLIDDVPLVEDEDFTVGTGIFFASNAIWLGPKVLSVAALAPFTETVFEVETELQEGQVRKVYRAGVELVLGVGYSVGDGDPDPAGAIVLATPLLSGQTLTVFYGTPLDEGSTLTVLYAQNAFSVSASPLVDQEIRRAFIDGAELVDPDDFSEANGNIVLVVPLEEDAVLTVWQSFGLPGAIPAGTPTYFDVHGRNVPHYTHLISTDEVVIEAC